MAENLKPGSKIYLLAICGTGMSALAALLKSQGHIVAGSDVAAYPPVGPFLEKLQIPVHIGFDVEDLVTFKPDYVVIGNFIRRDNAQAQYVIEKKIPYGSFPSTLENFYLKKTKNFVVVGTHGKTTTSTCMAHVLNYAGKDPSYLVGGVPVNFDSSSHFGKSPYFVIEGDEYDTAFFDKESKFLHYCPTYAFMMSIEYDHADIFPNIEAMEKMFRKFIHIVDRQGVIFHCADWPRLGQIIKEEEPAARTVTFGFEPTARHVIQNYQDGPEGMRFSLDGTLFKCSMTGRFNAQNFAAAILAARQIGIADRTIVEALGEFKGVKRRQEIRGKVGEHLVIDDFAHHPTAVREVLRGLRAKYPQHKIVVFFEPRSNTSRRAVLQKEFESAFLDADEALIAPVFRLEALAADDRLNVQKISDEHRKKGRVVLGPLTTDEMLEHAHKSSRTKPCVFVVLSNGSFDDLHEKLLSRLKSD